MSKTEQNKPQIMYLDNKKEKNYVTVDHVVSIGYGTNCDIVVPKGVSLVDEKHLLFYYEEDEQIYCVKNLSQYPVLVESTKANIAETLEKDGVSALGKSNSILIGDQKDRKKNFILFWKDPHAYEEVVNDFRRLNVDTVEDELLAADATKLRKAYFSKLKNKIKPEAHAVCKFTAKWILDNFNVGSSSIYKKIGGRWRCMASYRHNFKDRKQPSTMMFRKALDVGNPFLAKISGRDVDSQIEIGNEIEDPSLSIISSPAKRICVFPLTMNKIPYGMLYLDAPSEDLDDKSFMLLERLLEREGLAYVLSGYLRESVEEIKFLKKQSSPLPKISGWEYVLYTSKSPYPIFVRKNCEDDFGIRFIYGYVGDDLPVVTKTKAFLDGALSVDSSLYKSDAALENVEGFVRSLSARVVPRFVQIRATYEDKYPDIDDLKLQKLNIDNEGSGHVPHVASVMSWGNIYIYVSQNGRVKFLKSVGEDEEIALAQFEPGDFIVASMDRVRPKLLEDISPLEVKKFVREAFLLYRKS